MTVAEIETGFDVRRLGPQDTDAAASLCPFENLDAKAISLELSERDYYCWLGLHSPNGDLAAVHRGMRWHDYFLLKGLFVDPRFAATSVGLRTAMAMRDCARELGYKGVLAWVEPGRREAQLAARLRLRPSSGLLHRYLVPLPQAGEKSMAPPTHRRALGGTLGIEIEGDSPPLVPELLGIQQPRPGVMTVAWVQDRSRMLLSGNPCSSINDLTALLEAAEQCGQTSGATSLELLFEAADLDAALHLATRGAKRLSRTPVLLGASLFGENPSPIDDQVDRAPHLGEEPT